MTIKLGSLKADLKRETDGEFVEIPDLPGVAFKVRSVNYLPYRIARDMLGAKLLRRFKGKPCPADIFDVEIGKLYAAHLLLDWRGLDEPYTPEGGAAVCCEPEYRPARAHVEWAISQLGEPEIEFAEESAKN